MMLCLQANCFISPKGRWEEAWEHPGPLIKSAALSTARSGSDAQLAAINTASKKIEMCGEIFQNPIVLLLQLNVPANAD